MQPSRLGEIEAAVLAGIERRATDDPNGEIAGLHRNLLRTLRQPNLHASTHALAQARAYYQKAAALTFPATTAYLEHSHGISGLTLNASLMAVNLELLRGIDLLAHADPTYGTFVVDMKAILAKVKSPPDPTAYSQFFEIYAEAMVLHFLRGRGIRTSRVADTVSAPDFCCELEDGREYFVEVKALDIVGGAHRHKEIMEDHLETHVEIERQLREGRSVASAAREIAPLRKPHIDNDYDSYGLKRLIDTIRDKCRHAFKPQQFERGPTFALIVADRLILPGRKASIVPYYYSDGPGGQACISGELWHAAYGTVGAPVLRMPEFEGKPSVEGHLDAPGLYVDDTRIFPGKGLVTLHKIGSTNTRVSYGLKAPQEDSPGWGHHDTEEALHAMTDVWNDKGNTRGWALAHSGKD